MLLGPVFRAELIRTARRRRYYLLRVCYGLILLFLIWEQYVGLVVVAEMRGGMPSIADVANFATQTFVAFAAVQITVILALVPALFGGVIADEKQRKTIHYLMASRLASGEIVLDKLAARLLHVGVFLLLGLPVMSLLTLFGGVAWEYVAVAYAGTCTSTFFAAVLATLVSTLARGVRQAVVVSYVLVAFWVFVPFVAGLIFRALFGNAFAGFQEVNRWIMTASPLYLWWRATIGPLPVTPAAPWVMWGPRGLAVVFDAFLWMAGLQLASGLVFLIVAVWQLRPTFRRQESSGPRLTWFSPRWRRPHWLRRPACGADAMLWKERHFTPTDVFTKLFVLPATVLLTVGVILIGRFDETVVRSMNELWRRGISAPSFARHELNENLRAVSPCYLALWLLAVAGASATSVAGERERDTWTGLIATPLEGWEILRGKAIGAVWGLRGFRALVGLFWLVALAAGGVHPLGLLLALLTVLVLTWFVAAVGTYASLTARSSSRAVTASIVVLALLNGGYLVALDPALTFFSGSSGDWRYRDFGCTPYLASCMLFSFEEVQSLAAQMGHLRETWRGLMPAVAYGSLVLGGYAAAAALLTWRAILRFDVVSERPRRRDLASHRLDTVRTVRR
jgi:ABC-type transport system involved in multi-copper enzyme maturation permease subunit